VPEPEPSAALVPVAVTVVDCHASPGALDALAVDGAVSLRVAPDEAMLLARPPSVDLADAAERRLAALDPGGAVVDVTDGWAALALSGPGARAAFSRLSAVGLPSDGFVACDVARLPARVVATRDEVLVLVPSTVEAWFVDAARRRCPELAAPAATGSPR
jgi:sarcosine oxidase gamma subunit